MFFFPSSHAMFLAIWITADLLELAWFTLHQHCLHRIARWPATRFVMNPDIGAMKMMLPGRLKRTICLPAACAMNSAPLVFTSKTYTKP